MKTVAAIAHNAFRDAMRRKTFYVLVFLGIITTITSSFVPTMDHPDSRIKISLVIFSQVTMVICIIGVIFLSATSIPQEIEDKTIYGILSKPVSRTKIILGKVLGFSMVSGLLLILLSFINLMLILQMASGLPERYKGNILKARKELKISRFHIHGQPHHVREGIAWFNGGSSGAALWSFSYPASPVESMVIEAECNIKIETTGDFPETIPVKVDINNTGSDKTISRILIIRADEPFIVPIDTVITREGGEVAIMLSPVNEQDYLGITPESVSVFSVQNGFILNYGKAIIITYMKFLLILTVAVMCSTCLSSPVSISLALVIFLCGHILDFLKDISLIAPHHDAHVHHLPAGPAEPHVFLTYANWLVKEIMEWVSVVLPDFKRFDNLRYLLNGINIPLVAIGASTLYSVMYVSICLFLSAVIFKKREFI